MGNLKKLRVGVVGSGFGAIVHVPAFRAHDRFELVAIASPTRAADIAAEQGIPRAFPSCEEMLDGVDLDVVSIASPPFQHHADVLAALAANKHVLCEKPFALNLAQARELFARSQEVGTVCALALEFRYVSALLAMRELVANKHLGALRHIEVTLFGSNLRASVQRQSSWWFDRSKGGGVANAYMPHLFDLALWLSGSPVQTTTGLLRTANSRRSTTSQPFISTVADGAFAFLDLGDGLIATVTVDMTHATESALVAVHGEIRTAVANGKALPEMTMFTVDEEETAELTLRPNPHAKLAIARPTIPLFMSLLDDFAQAVEGKPSTTPTFTDGLAVQHCLEAIGYSYPP